jgi:branched-subunit amino acid aminotransferase/4-amino-4-deoxychorismate lyase
MVDTRTFRWSDGALVADVPEQSNTNRVRVADSWLTVDGAVAGLDRHIERFTGSVRLAFPDVDVDSFVHATLASLPRTGRWFPRIEAIDDGSGEPLVRFRLRDAPEPLTDAILATSPQDPRTETHVKGPDLDALGALRTELGVGEAVILDGDGFIAEGAWSSIVWWLGESLHVVDSSIARLPGVTESLILDYAQSIATPVTRSRSRPEDLDGAEVWVLSSLHGIRVATNWRNGPSLQIKTGRAEQWRLEYAKNRRVVFSP